MILHLYEPLAAVPDALAAYHLTRAADGCDLVYTYDARTGRTGITDLLEDLRRADIRFKDLQTTQSSLEDIFVDLLRKDAEAAA